MQDAETPSVRPGMDHAPMPPIAPTTPSGGLSSAGPWTGPMGAAPLLAGAAHAASRFSCDAYQGYSHYFPGGQRDQGASAMVTGIGAARIQPGAAYPPTEHPKLYQFDWRRGRKLPEHQAILITEGRGEFDSEPTGLVSFSGPTLLLVFPGVWHRYRPDAESGWTERWLSVDGPLVRGCFAESQVGPRQAVCPLSAPEPLRQAFDRLAEKIVGAQGGRSEAVGLSVVRTVSLLLEQAAAQQPAAKDMEAAEARAEIHDEVVRLALEIIWNHSHSPPLGVNEVARRLPVTRRTLDRRFAETLGRSVLDEINACRLSRARRLLAETDMPIKTVSFLAGFPSRERMRLMFLASEGVTPSDYRERVHKSSLS